MSAKIFHRKSSLRPVLLGAASGVNFSKKKDFEQILINGKFHVIRDFLNRPFTRKYLFFKYSSIYDIVSRNVGLKVMRNAFSHFQITQALQVIQTNFKPFDHLQQIW